MMMNGDKRSAEVKIDEVSQEPDQKKIKISDVFKVAPGGVKLVSADGVSLYIEAFYLQAASPVLRAKLAETPLPGSTEKKPALPIDASEHVLTLFLEMIKGSPSKREYTEAELSSLIDLANKYETSSVLLFLRTNIRDQLLQNTLDPWDTYVLASKFADLDLARTAVKKMGEKHSWIWNGPWSTEKLYQPKGEYATKLINGCLWAWEAGGGKARGANRWETLASKI